jgi:hypothetical protein
MRFTLSEALLAKLRAAQARRTGHDEIAEREDAFMLDPGMGPPTYLTADGRVLLDVTDWEDGAVREASDDEAIAGLVAGAKKTGVTELLDLVPPCPAHAQTCAACHGGRWMQFGTEISSGKPGRIVCWECSGRGWSIKT